MDAGPALRASTSLTTPSGVSRPASRATGQGGQGRGDQPAAAARAGAARAHRPVVRGRRCRACRTTLPDEADYLLGGRVQIINVWRPVGRPVARDPLTVAEAQSVPDSDLVPTGLIYPERGDGKPRRSGETLQVRHNAAHRWFYKSHLSPDEVLLIKCFDSKTDGRARRVPHSAFVDPGASPDAPTRQSIEVRALVFHENDRE